MSNQLLDGCLGGVEFFASLQQLLLLRGKAVVLLECLLVDVLVLLELLIDIPEPLRYLITRRLATHPENAHCVGGILTSADLSFMYLVKASSGRTPKSRMLFAISSI